MKNGSNLIFIIDALSSTLMLQLVDVELLFDCFIYSLICIFYKLIRCFVWKIKKKYSY